MSNKHRTPLFYPQCIVSLSKYTAKLQKDLETNVDKNGKSNNVKKYYQKTGL